MAELLKDGTLMPKAPQRAAKYAKESGSTEVADIIKKSHFVGKWLAAAGTPATIFTALGVSLGSRS
jgi:hypothetical protein